MRGARSYGGDPRPLLEQLTSDSRRRSFPTRELVAATPAATLDSLARALAVADVTSPSFGNLPSHGGEIIGPHVRRLSATSFIGANSLKARVL